MRPDQHKKKRSTQYKKKHGISDKPKNDDSKNNSKKEKSSSGQGSTQWQLPQKQLNNTKDKTEEEDSNNGSSAEEDDMQASFFRRRKLMSNWDRYQSLPPENEDETPSEIGTDFGKLLSQTADALSQFRFKDEKEWEEDKTLLSSNFVALDCEALANSIYCVPLHERLGLDAAFFSDEQLEAFCAEAEKKRLLYNPDSCSTIVQEEQNALDVGAMHNVLSAAMHLIPSLLKTVKAESTNPENGVQSVSVEEAAAENVVPENEKSVKKSESDTVKKKNSTCVLPQALPCDPVSQEDELDMLLSLGNTKPQTDIDESVNIKQSVEISAPLEKKYVSSATSSLEDWLDSVLDS